MAASGTASLTVLVAGDGLSQGVLDVLQDLSAAGLLEPFLWADAGGVAEAGVPALRVERGRLTGTTVQDELVSASYGTVRLAVLVSLLPGGQPIGGVTEQRLLEVVSRSSGRARVVRLRLLLVRPGSKADPGDVARDGWHNVLLSPEDSAGPGRGHLPLAADPDHVDVGRYAGPLVASLAGLWAGIVHAPLDGQASLPGENVLAARSFYRRLEARAVESELVAQVTSLDSGFPLPRLQGARAVQVEDVELATSDMARRLWSRHLGALRGPRTRPAVEEAAPVSWRRALTMMFRFLWAALRGAPGQWYAALVNRASSAVAGAVHTVVFGHAPAAFTVVVRGMTPEGLPAGWRELGEASAELDGMLDDAGGDRQHEARTDVSALWRDYVAGATTLADAGERSAALQPVQVGADRGVVRSHDDCVPSPGQTFRPPPHLAAVTGVDQVEPYDVLGIRHLEQCLRHGSDDAGAATAATQTAERLRSWRNAHERSYAVQVGTVLADAVTATAQEVKGLLQALAAAADLADVDQAGPAHQLRVAQRVRLLLWGLAGVLLLVGLARWASWLTLGRALLLGAGAVVVWAVASVLVFLHGQRELFRELNRRRTLVAEADAARANVKQAARDLRRLTDAYAQFLSWSRVLGSFLQAPFGSPTDTDHDGVRAIDGLPRAIDVAVGRPDERSLAEASSRLRRHLFTPGWLEAPWRDLLSSAWGDLARYDRDLANDPQRLFSEQGAGSGSPLDGWSQQLVDEGVRPRSRDRLWGQALDRLKDDERTAVADAVLEGVQSIRPGSRVVPRSEFMQGLDELPAGEVGDRPSDRPFVFEHGTFRDEALTASRNRVTGGLLSRADDGLGQVTVLTQLSEGLPVHHFTFTDTGEPETVAPRLDGPVF